MRNVLGYSWLTARDIIRISGAEVTPAKIWKIFRTDVMFGIVETEIVKQNGRPVRIYRRVL